MHLLVLSAFRLWTSICLFQSWGVSMHLLVLSAFRQYLESFWWRDADVSQCTFWCSVLSDAQRRIQQGCSVYESQCTFWCSVLSDFTKQITRCGNVYESQCTFWCSVLSDPRLKPLKSASYASLNAPFGAQCFPTGDRQPRTLPTPTSQCTFWCSVLSDPDLPSVTSLPSCLNAPFGAQCFPT